METEIRKTIPFTTALKKKYPGINLTKEVKIIYNENFKTLKKKTEDARRGKDLCSRIGRINVQMARLPKVIFRFSAIPIKIPKTLFAELDKIILNLYRNTRDPEQSKQKEQVRRHHNIQFQTVLSHDNKNIIVLT